MTMRDIMAVVRIHDMCQNRKECAGCLFSMRLGVNYGCILSNNPESWKIDSNESEEKTWKEEE